jgi:transposase
VRRAVKVRIYPILEQVGFHDWQFGAVRFVWNKALAIKTHRYRVRGAVRQARPEAASRTPRLLAVGCIHCIEAGGIF